MGKQEDKEVGIMVINANDYDEKVFLSELENSLKEMCEKKQTINNNNSNKSSWRDLFTMDEE